MSLLKSKSSFLSIKPRVEDHGAFLSIRTNAFLRVLGLWSYDHLVEIDADRRRIEVSKRRLWAFTRTRTIEFDEVEQVDYSYHSMGTSWSYFRRNDSVESYRLSLILITGERVPVATFRGEGAEMTGLGGVFRGDDVVDLEGDQEDRSRDLFDRLEAMLATKERRKLGAPPPNTATRACVDCGQVAPPNRSNCLYCGGRVEHRSLTPTARVVDGSST